MHLVTPPDHHWAGQIGRDKERDCYPALIDEFRSNNEKSDYMKKLLYFYITGRFFVCQWKN